MAQRVQLTTKLIKDIAQTVEAGNFLEPAAGMYGVRSSTLYKWLAHGKELVAARDVALDRFAREFGMGTEPPDGVGEDGWTERDRLCVEFVEVTQKAQDTAEVRVVAQVQTAIPTAWQAGFRWLESRAKDRWFRTTRTEITGAGGGPVQVESARDRLTGKVDAIAKRLLEAPAGLPGEGGSS
jgi:hypothetical protein